MNRIICLLVFGKISSSFNYVDHLTCHALNQRLQVLNPKSSQPRVPWWPPSTRGCWLWTGWRSVFFSSINSISFRRRQIRNSIVTFLFSLDQCSASLHFVKRKRKRLFFFWAAQLKKKTHFVQIFATTHEINSACCGVQRNNPKRVQNNIGRKKFNFSGDGGYSYLAGKNRANAHYKSTIQVNFTPNVVRHGDNGISIPSFKSVNIPLRCWIFRHTREPLFVLIFRTLTVDNTRIRMLLSKRHIVWI